MIDSKTPEWIVAYYSNRKKESKNGCNVCGFGFRMAIHLCGQNERGIGIPYHEFVYRQVESRLTSDLTQINGVDENAKN